MHGNGVAGRRWAEAETSDLSWLRAQARPREWSEPTVVLRRPPDPRPHRPGWRLIAAEIVVAASVVAGLVFWFGSGNSVAAPGSCVSGTSTAADVEIVDCASKRAGFVVVGAAAGKAPEEANLVACAAYPAATAAFWVGAAGAPTGTVVCLRGIVG